VPETELNLSATIRRETGEACRKVFWGLFGADILMDNKD